MTHGGARQKNRGFSGGRVPRWAWGLAAMAGAAAVGWGIAATAYTVFSPVSTQVVPGPVVYRTATVTATVSRTATRTVTRTRTVQVPGPVVYRTVPVTVPAAPATVTVTVTAPPASP